MGGTTFTSYGGWVRTIVEGVFHTYLLCHTCGKLSDYLEAETAVTVRACRHCHAGESRTEA